MLRRRAISDLLTPGAMQFQYFRGMRGRGCRPTQPLPVLPGVCQAGPSSFLQNLSFKGGKNGEHRSHCPTGRCGQIESLSKRHEADAQVLQFLKRRQEIRDGSSLAIEPSDQHYVNLSAACGFQDFVPRLSLHRPGANFTDLHGDRPAAPSGILSQSAALHRQRLLIVGGNAGVEAGSEHFRRQPCLAKNVIGFCL